MVENNDENNQQQDTKSFDRLSILFVAGLALIFVGIIVIIAASASGSSGSSVSGGIVIFIGPLPIVIGTGPDASWLILISVILAIISIVSLIMLRRRS